MVSSRSLVQFSQICFPRLQSFPETRSSRVSRLRLVAHWLCTKAPQKAVLLLLLLASLSVSLRAQTIDDGFMIPKRELFTGVVYSYDYWDRYWEGTLKRGNGNLGTITTRTSTWTANYGITDRLNVITTVPYVWTRASQGVLHGMQGFQDITLAVKYSLLETDFTKHGHLRAIVIGYGAVPLTGYTPDFQPLSLGSASKRASGRFTLNFQANRGWFLNGSGAYTWRDNVKLARPYYYTNGQLFESDEVAMPNVFDYIASAGYLRRGMMTALYFTQQITKGGGDIRRQDIPFVSNRMNFSKLGATVIYPLPKLRNLAFQFTVFHAIDGRNVGQDTTFTTALLYTLNSHGRRPIR